MGDNEKEVATKLIDTLGVDPCLLAIVVIVLAFIFLMGTTAKEKEKIERQRVKDALDAVERIVNNGK